MDIVANYHPVFKAFLAGSFSGTFSTVLLQPLDLVKTRLQNPGHFVTAANVNGRIQPGMIAIFANIVRQEHIVGLWRGMVPSVARCVPGVGLYFSSLHWLKAKMGKTRNQDLGPLEAVALGVVARAMSGVALIPMTVIKTRLCSSTAGHRPLPWHATEHDPRPLSSSSCKPPCEDHRSTESEDVTRYVCRSVVSTQELVYPNGYRFFWLYGRPIATSAYESGVYKYTSLTGAFKAIYSTEGLRGLSCGLGPTLARDAPFSGLYLMFYTQTKQAVPKEWLQSPSAASAIHFTCGIVAGIAASLATNPADVLKTKMQLYPDKFPNAFSAALYVHQTYGIKGYFKGAVPRMLRRTLMAAMAWTIFEEITRSIGLK
ncbi:hypothetical protein MSG28_004242 [Choristoneura fumiferana]|uniref:Uncharacterized protein n=1 Tax=Choristoneura fumiferana TaxID=7141 RepID=A0ACC0KIB9_CHOFU|nr:hypothetical protein MSG28_004242 [Choristoneura fumiferana]